MPKHLEDTLNHWGAKIRDEMKYYIKDSAAYPQGRRAYKSGKLHRSVDYIVDNNNLEFMWVAYGDYTAYGTYNIAPRKWNEPTDQVLVATKSKEFYDDLEKAIIEDIMDEEAKK